MKLIVKTGVKAMAGNKEIPNRKEELFRLFDKGKVPTDPEVKALRYKSGTVYTFYSEWKHGKGTVKATGKWRLIYLRG